MKKQDNTVIDANTQTMRCLVCGDEIPIPFGELKWVCKVMNAFADAHRGNNNHGGGRTQVSIPVKGIKFRQP